MLRDRGLAGPAEGAAPLRLATFLNEHRGVLGAADLLGAAELHWVRQNCTGCGRIALGAAELHWVRQTCWVRQTRQMSWAVDRDKYHSFLPAATEN